MAQDLVGQAHAPAGQDEAVPAGGAVGPGDAVLDVRGAPTQGVAGALAHQHDGALGPRRRRQAACHRGEVGPGRHLVGAGRAVEVGLAAHPGEPEDPLGAAVGVEPHGVPAARVAGDAPRLEVPGRRRIAGPGVLEAHRHPVADRVEEDLEGRLVGAQPGLDDVEAADVDLDAGGGELADRVGRGVGEPGVVPHLRRQPDDSGLLGVEVDRRQRQLVAAHPVARLVVEVGVHGAHLDRHAEAAQLLLVAVELALEGVVGVVGVEDLADPLLGHEVALDEQHDQQVEQPLGLRGRLLLGAGGRVGAHAGPAQPAPRMSTTK